MSFDPSSYPGKAYSGTPNFSTLANDAVQVVNPVMGKRCVPLSFNWNIYFTALAAPNISIPINLQGGNTQGGLLDKIRAVKIDNTNSTVPVTVFFPDTNDLITAGPDSIVQGPVITNGARCFIVAQGLSVGALPSTNVFLYNFYLPPASDIQVPLGYPQWIGSPSIQRANVLTPGFGPPCLGDQTVQYQVEGDPLAAPVIQLWNTPLQSGFFYVQNMQVMGVYTFNGSGSNNLMEFSITGSISGLLYRFFALALNNGYLANQRIYSGHGLNLRLNATETWHLNRVTTIAGNQGIIELFMNYSYNPTI